MDSPEGIRVKLPVCPPPYQRVGGAHSPAAKGVGESQFQRLEKRLALCLLCGLQCSPLLATKLTYKRRSEETAMCSREPEIFLQKCFLYSEPCNIESKKVHGSVLF
jgi:hypothetical protein